MALDFYVKKQSCAVIVYTPFQAWQALKVLEAEQISSYDLLYISRFSSTEDQNFFKKLSQNADIALYHVEGIKKFENKTLIKKIRYYFEQLSLLKKHFGDKKYEKIIFSSYVLFEPQWFVGMSKDAEIITFDDGTANYYSTSFFYNPPILPAFELFKVLIGCSSSKKVRRLIARHYTLHPQLDNIVTLDKRVQLEISMPTSVNSDIPTKGYFIGQPFEDVLDQEQISRIKNQVANLPINFYVQHPREQEQLLADIPSLNKEGQIAEEAIINNAVRDGHNASLYGGFSTVFFNLPIPKENKTMILLKDQQNFEETYKLAKKVCGSIVVI